MRIFATLSVNDGDVCRHVHIWFGDQKPEREAICGAGAECCSMFVAEKNRLLTGIPVDDFVADIAPIAPGQVLELKLCKK